MTKRDLKIGLFVATLVTVLSFPTVLNVVSNFSTNFQIAISLTLGILTIVGLLVVRFLSRWLQILWQIGKFGVVGGLNTFVDFGILNLLILVAGVAAGLWFGVFKGISFTVAVINSYFWNKYWTFEAASKKKTEFVEFLVVSLFGLGINVGVATLAVNVIGPLGNLGPVLWANIAAFLATLAALTWNFIGYKFIVFKKTEKA
ncbi:MAG TPA: GtrA family protein [Candidatus Paceibacterota bacterium]